MYLIVPLTVMTLASQTTQLPSPVLPIELISRNTAGIQSQATANAIPIGISENGSKVAFSVYDPAFFGETPTPPIFGAPSSTYGQIAIWQRSLPLRPLIRFPDGLGSNDSYSPKTAEVSFDKFEGRTCFISFAGDLVRGTRFSSDVTAFCEGPDGRYEHAGILPQTGEPGFTNGLGGPADLDIYGPFHIKVRNRRTGVVEFVNLDAQGALGQVTISPPFSAIATWPRLSNDGRYAVFVSNQNTLTPDDTNSNDDGSDVFIRDRVQRTTRRLTHPNGSEFLGKIAGADIAANGSIVLFTATGDVVEPCSTGSPDPRAGRSLYSYEIATQKLECVSVSDDNQYMGVQFVAGVDVSGDGRFVLFNSFSAIDPADTNQRLDLFIRDRVKKRTYWVSQAADGSAGLGSSFHGMLSEDGNWLAFSSLAPNLVPGDLNGVRSDVFLRDLRPLKSELLQLPSNDLRSMMALALLLLCAGFCVKRRALA